MGLLASDPIELGGEAEDVEEARGGLLISGCDGAPLLQPRPQAFDPVGVVVDRVRAGDRRLVAQRRDRRTSA